jgi:predicted RND superfamily exporter protein
LIPLAACFATMRLLGLGLRIDSSLFLCVSVGGLFNTTIHVVARILQQLETPDADPDAVVAQALRTVGPASFYTAAILSLGFAVLLSSEFAGLRQLGLLSMVTLVTGFLSDVIVTSALMRFFTGRAVRRSSPPVLQPTFMERTVK